MSAHTPHKQLKAIRKVLNISQSRAATMLGVSHPYFISVETGQRKLSRALAAKIAEVFGVPRIQKEGEIPLVRDSKGNFVPFTKEFYRKYTSSLPTFWIDEDSAGPEGARLKSR